MKAQRFSPFFTEMKLGLCFWEDLYAIPLHEEASEPLSWDDFRDGLFRSCINHDR
jgi:hypothetical protein